MPRKIDPEALALMMLIWGLPDDTTVLRLREIIVKSKPPVKR